MYSETELKKILNVAYLNRNGYKISKIAILDDDELTGNVMIVSSRHDDPNLNFQPGKVLMSALRFNEDQFKEVKDIMADRQSLEGTGTVRKKYY
jgi:hypothetical protein